MDSDTALLDAVDSLAVAAARPGLSGSERLSRMTVLRDAVTDVQSAAALDPYRTGRHSIIADTLAAARAQSRGVDDHGAGDRLARHRLANLLRAAIDPQTTLDTPGLLTARPAGLPIPDLPVTTPLLALASPATDLNGPTVDLPHYGAWPEAVIDPTEKTALTTLGLDLGTTPTAVHTSAYGVNLALQVEHWAPDGLARIQACIGTVVDRGLEKALLTDLAAAAGTPLADLDAAEAAVATATGAVADTIVVNPVDVAKVRTHYAPAVVPLQVASTAGLPAGVALVMARPAVWILAGPLGWLSAVEPRLIGRAVVALRYGSASPWIDGAVSAATLV